MKITLSIIAKELSTVFLCKQNREQFTDAPLNGVLFYCGSLVPGNLHIITAEEITTVLPCDESVALLCLGEPATIPTDCDCIYLPEERDFKKVYNAIEDINHRFYSWLNNIRYSHSSMDELQKILNLSHEYLKHELLINNKNYIFLASTEGYIKKFGKDMGETKLNLDMLNRLWADNAFRTADQHNKTFYYEYPGGKTLCYNIKIDEIYQARLLCDSQNETYSQGDEKLIEYLGRMLTEVFQRDFKKNIKRRKRDALNRILLDILEGKSPNHKKISPILKEQGWTIQCSYRMICFDEFHITGGAEFSEEYYCSYLEETFYGSTVLKHRNKIIMIVNRNQMNKEERLFRSDLEHFLVTTDSKAGIGNDFSDISLLSFYERQAELALKIGKQKNKSARQYSFSQYRFESIFEITSSYLLPEHLCNPMLFQLRAYDEREGTELSHTLYCYIKNQFNATRTAKELFIHRTTLLTRLERIKIVCDIPSFDSQELILDLMFSYQQEKNNSQ